MRDLGGRPHWAKNFTTLASAQDIHEMYGDDMDQWLKVRQEVDPDGLFVGEWHRRNLLLTKTTDSENALLSLGERREIVRKFGRRGAGDGLEWIGDRRWEREPPVSLLKETLVADSPSPPMTTTSEESFDLLAHGEASILISDKH